MISSFMRKWSTPKVMNAREVVDPLLPKTLSAVRRRVRVSLPLSETWSLSPQLCAREWPCDVDHMAIPVPRAAVRDSTFLFRVSNDVFLRVFDLPEECFWKQRVTKLACSLTFWVCLLSHVCLSCSFCALRTWWFTPRYQFRKAMKLPAAKACGGQKSGSSSVLCWLGTNR